jgi:hypothetical protein
MRKRRGAFGALLLAVAFAATGCPKRTTIGELNGDPGRFQGKEVAVAGRVTNSYGALGRGVFEIDDGTGRIWVMTEKNGVPGNGAQVGVSGQIVSGVSYGGRTFGTVLREKERRSARDR